MIQYFVQMLYLISNLIENYITIIIILIKYIRVLATPKINMCINVNVKATYIINVLYIRLLIDRGILAIFCLIFESLIPNCKWNDIKHEVSTNSAIYSNNN